MNQVIKKINQQLLRASLRGGDFVHPGEECALDLVLAKVDAEGKNILDIGCGIGGSLGYLRKHGFSKATGIDVDQEVIHYAKEKYRDCDFLCADASQISKVLAGQQFDVVTMINSLFLLQDQPLFLKSLNAITAASSKLAIFDYIKKPNADEIIQFSSKPETGLCQPLELKNYQEILNQSGWKVISFTNLDDQFINWYTILCNQLDAHKQQLIEQYSEHDYLYSIEAMQSCLDYVTKGQLGGALIIAEPIQ